MHLWRAALVILMAAAALPLCETARAESPPPPAAVVPQPPSAPPAATAPAAAPPAQPAATPAAPAKGPAVILASLPPMSDVFGGKVEFAEKAFPIVAESKAVAVEAAIRGAKPLPCQACRGTGKIAKREMVRPPTGAFGKPITQTWDEDCPACGGYKDVYDPRIVQRLLEVVDRLGHVARDEKFDALRKSAEERLAVAVEVREKILPAFRCEPVTTTRYSTIADRETETLTDVKVVPAQGRPFRVDAAPLVEPLWTRVGPQAPTGQAVIIIGTTSEKTEAAGWMWMRMKPAAKGQEAIILCGTAQTNVVPAGRIVLGGLMIGRWIPEGSEAASPPPAPAAGAKAPPPPTVGPLQPGMLPVILAVIAIEGK